MRRTKSMLNLGLFLAMAILTGWFLPVCDKAQKPLKYSSIHEAAAKGDLEDVKNHLRRGKAVNEPGGPYGATPLHVAAGFNQVKVADFLIKNGAEVNAEVRGYIPLEAAAERGHKEMVKLLVRNGAKVSADAIGKMIDKGHTEAALDMAKNADFSVIGNIVLWPRSRKGSVEVATILLKRRVDVKALTSALSDAVVVGNAEIAELLLKHGANINWKDLNGDNLLHSVWETSGRGDRYRKIDIVKVLIKNRIDLNAKNKEGSTPLHAAVSYGYRMYDRIKIDPMEAIKLLLDNGADVNAKDNKGNTPLHHTAWHKEEGIARLLIDKGADVNEKNNHGDSPLHETARSQEVRIAILLINKGADVNARNNSGETPLAIARKEPSRYYSYEKSREQLIDILRIRGAKE